MPTPKLNLGDVVCLKSGGPLMTVQEFQTFPPKRAQPFALTGKQVICNRCVGSELKSEWFPVECLVKEEVPTASALEILCGKLDILESGMRTNSDLIADLFNRQEKGEHPDGS